MLQLCALHNNSSSYSKNYRNCTRPSWLCPAPTRSALTNQAETGNETKIHRYQTVQAQTSLILSIPNYILPRQAKSVELCILFQHSQIKSAISPQIIKTVVEVARCAPACSCGACPRLRIGGSGICSGRNPPPFGEVNYLLPVPEPTLPPSRQQ